MHVHLACVRMVVHKKHMHTCFSMRTRTWVMRMHNLVCTSILGLANTVLCPNCAILLFFHLFISNMILMLIFFLLCRVYNHIQVGVTLNLCSNGIGP